MYSQISARIIQYWNHGNTMMVYENDCLNKAKLLPKSSPNGNGKMKALGLMTFAAVDVNIPVQYHFYFALCDCNNFYCKCFARSNK